MKHIANPVIVEALQVVAIGEWCYDICHDHMVLPLTLEDAKQFNATREQLARWTPAVGDYVVIQSDGYTYGNPAAVFERKYTPLIEGQNLLSFGWAIEMMRLGYKVCREGWNGKGMWLYHVQADTYPVQSEVARQAFGEMVPYQAYIAMKTAQGTVVPWLASQTDMLSSDWKIAA